MKTIYLDFETYYDREYSLSKMSTIEYVLDPRFKMLGCSVAIDHEPAVFMDEDTFRTWVRTVDWSDVLMVAHNALFDGTVLTQRFGVRPARYACTQAEARALLPCDSASLRTVARLLGVGEKGDALVAGSDVVSQSLIDYANNDVELCRRIHEVLYPYFPEKERELMSMTIRWGVEPMICLDKALLEESLKLEIEQRNAAIKASGYPEEVLTSNQKFEQLLEQLGLPVPTKISQTTGEETAALARGDAEFQALMAAYPEYAHVFEGRLAAKSNIKIKRAEKLLKIANLPSKLPVPLNYYGAHTGRWSGTDGINLQNLPRQNVSPLRRALRAPKGYLIGAADSSQIELRLNMWFSRELGKLEMLRSGVDIYKHDAASFFGVAVEEVTSEQRQFGKVRQLGLGYRMGVNRFKQYCAAGPLGMKPILLTMEEALKAVYGYRAEHPNIVASWETMEQFLYLMTDKGADFAYGPITVKHEMLVLPNGMILAYPGLRQTEEGKWMCGVDKKVRYLHSGLIQENVIQALARIVVAEQMLDMDRWLQESDENSRVVAMTHDEVIFLVKEELAEEAEKKAVELMSTPPAWAEDLPLGAEVKLAEYYSK